MIFLVRFFILLFSIFIVTSSISQAQETLLIYADNNAKPKNWLDDNNQAQGIHIEILNEVTKRTGIQFTYIFAPWKRVYVESEKGRGGIIGFSKTTERQKHWDYSNPMYYDELVFVTLILKKFTFTGFESIRDLNIGIKRGASYGDDFEKAIADGIFNIVETTQRAGQLRMLTKNRVDAVLLSPGRIALESIIAENDWLIEHKNDFSIIDPPYKLDPNYLGIPKSMEMSYLLGPINKALQEIMNDGTHADIVKRVTDKLIKEIHSQ